jgi:hypothetical protein
VGDTQQLPVSDNFSDCADPAAVEAYMGFLYASSGGKKGKPPGTLHKVYPCSGYAIFRSAWGGHVT